MAGDETVASIHVRVRPDTSKFADELRRKLAAIEKKTKADIGTTADTSGFQADVKAAVKKASQEVVHIRVNYDDLSSVQQSMKQLQREMKKVSETPISMTFDEDAIGHELERLLAIDNRAFDKAVKQAREVFKSVGTINPDLDKGALQELERDMRKTFEKISQIEVELQDATLSKRARADLSAELSKLHAEIELDRQTLADMGDSVREAFEKAGDSANFSRLAKHAQAALDSIKFRPNVSDAEKRKLATQLEDAFERIDEIQLKLSDQAIGARDKIRLERELADLRANVQVSLDSVRAEAGLATLVRDRVVAIKPVLDNRATRGVAQALGVLSGGRIAAELAGDFRALLTNIDKTTVASGLLATGLNVLGAAMVAASADVLSFGQSLVELAPLGLALPGILGGMAVGAAATFIAFKDFGKVLPDVVDDLEAIADSASASFWNKAKRPIKEMADKILPKFAKGFDATAEASGNFFANFSRSLGREFGGNALARMFADLNESIDEFAEHTDGMASSIRILGEVGARQLPGLARWFGEISDSFANFLKEAERTGKLDQWIERATRRAQDLGGAVLNAGKALGALFKAADAAAPGDTFANLNKGLDDLQRKLNSGRTQRTLTNLFKAAHDSMENFIRGAGPGAGRFVDAFSESLSKTMPRLTGAFGNLLGSLLDMLASPKVQAGYQDFINGLTNGFDSLAPGVEALADKLGPVLSLMGELAEAIGEVGSAALVNLSPAIGELAKVLTPVVDDLGKDLTQFLEDLKPAFDELADQVKELQPGLEDCSEAFGKLVDSLGPFAKGPLPKLVEGLGLLTKLNLKVSAENIEALADSIDHLNDAFGGDGSVGGKIGSFVQAIGALGKTDLQGAGAAADILASGLERLMQSLGLDWDANANIFQNAMANIFDLDIMKLTPLGGFVDPIQQIWEKLTLSIQSKDWGQVGRDIINGLILGLVPAPLVEKMQALADRMIEKIKNVFGIHSPSTVMAEVGRDIIRGLLQGLREKIEDLGEIPGKIKAKIVGKLQGAGDWLRSTGGRIMAGLREGISTTLDRAAGALNSLKSKILGKLQGAGTWLLQKGRDILNGLGQGIRRQIDKALAGLKGIKGKVTGFFSGAADWLIDAGASIISGLGAGIESGIDTIKSKLQGLTAMIPQWKGPPKRDAKLLYGAGQIIIDGLRKGLESRFKSVQKSLNGLSAKIGKAKLSKSLAKSLTAKRTDLTKALGSWTSLNNKIKAKMTEIKNSALNYGRQVRESIRQLADPTQIALGDGQALDFSSVVGNYANVIEKAKQFNNVIKQLRRSKLDNTIIQQLLDAGPEKGLQAAQAILSGGIGGIKQLNKLQGELDKVSQSIGESGYFSMYETGLQAANGFIKGLEKQQKQIEKTMTKIASSMVKTIKKQLGIHSPSRVFKELGSYVGQGFEIGIRNEHGAVKAALQGMVATPAAGNSRLRPAVQGAGLGQTINQTKTINYYAAPNKTLTAREELLAAVNSPRTVF